MKQALILAVLIPLCAPAFGQSFTCRMGQRAACLDWGDSVCSSGGKCVRDSAACFDSYQCDYKGFACKSQVDQCVEVHDRLVRDYNDLVRDYEALRDAGKKLSDAFDELQADLDQRQGELQGLQAARAEAETCLLYARTLEQAKACLD
ncbi:MAG: hypothetical protein ACK4GO_14585 [Gemmobacter sp.]